jgi:hypothetical protein
MRTLCCTMLLVLGIALGSSTAFSADSAKDGDRERIARCVTQLGSEEYSQREAATRELDAVGPAALEALRKAQDSEDLEVRRRARALVSRIERRMEIARLLAPRRVHLVYRDTPVVEAVADFAKKTGFPIQLQGDTSKLRERTITLDTGDVTFWEAFEQFCQKAGVREVPAVTATPQPTTHEEQIRLQRALILRSRAYEQPAAIDTRLMLTAGTPLAEPTFRAGALRFRALPGQAATGIRQGGAETQFTLDVTPEPGLTWQGIVDVRIEKAIDEHGKVLSTAPAAVAAVPAPSEDGIMRLRELTDPGVDMSPNHLRQVPVRLQRSNRAARLLKEVQGTLAARVMAPPQPVLTIDQVMTAAGKKVENAESGSLTVVDVSRETDGIVRLRVQRENPTGTALFAGRRFRRAVVVVNGQVIDQGAGTNSESISLVDARGQSFQQVSSANTRTDIGGNGLWRQELVLTFKPQPGQGEPAKLHVNGRKTVAIEVPFTLRDVPLP